MTERVPAPASEDLSIQGRDGQNDDRSDRLKRLYEAANLHAIEGNPLSNDELAMFAMFERENWTHEQRRAHILSLPDAVKDGPQAAE